MTDNLGKETGRSSGHRKGASQSAIQAHYDVGNDFYRLWLDQKMIYSCAIWGKNDQNLDQAQDRKIEYHIRGAKASGCHSVLEIGCGWGACLKKLVKEHGVKEAVGLTLSDAQRSWIDQMNLPGVETRVESWADHAPTIQYDAIISIAAIAHFVRPELGRKERIEVYREFFSRCSDWMKPGGRLTIETQVYGQGAYIPSSPLSEIFPESDMPHLSELVEGFDKVFELDNMVNHRHNYPPTLRCWLSNLINNRDQVVSLAGVDVFERYERFLKAGIRGHDTGVFGLMRIDLSKSW